MNLPKTVKFTKNWNNKLDNNIFTTIRKNDYWVDDGDYCVIVLNDKVYCYAKCIDKEIISIKNMKPTILMLDTGLDLVNSYEIFNKIGIDFNKINDTVSITTFKRMPPMGQLSTAITKALNPGFFDTKLTE